MLPIVVSVVAHCLLNIIRTPKSVTNMTSFVLKVLIITVYSKLATCTISGISYMDPIKFGPHPDNSNGIDECNPLYWYPRQLPEHCFAKSSPTPPRLPGPPPDVVPMPIPVPAPPVHFGPPPVMPMPVPPMHFPPPPGMPIPAPPLHFPPSAAMPMPPSSLHFPPPPISPIMPPMPPQLPFGLPLISSHPILPMPGIPMPGIPMPGMPMPGISYGGTPPALPALQNYPYRRDQIGMVPGIPGIVSDDGGINILPFSDAYSDLLEKHKNKIVRKKIQKLFKDYPKFRRNRNRNRFYY